MNTRPNHNIESVDNSNDATLMFNPSQIEQYVHQCIQLCWMMLPGNKRNAAEVERQLRRIFERAIGNMREDDREFFGTGEKGE